MPNLKYEFHIAKEVRKKYDFSDELFSLNGNVIFANFIAVRNFVKKINDKRKVEERVSAGYVNAFGLIDEIYHYIFRIYETQINPGVFERALKKLNEEMGEDKIRKLLFEFCSVYPPLNVYKGKEEIYDYLNSYTDERANTLITLEELILLYFANINPSNLKVKELFDENYLQQRLIYKNTIQMLEEFFKNEKKVSPLNQDIFSLLKLPILSNPNDIEAQLDFIKEKFGILISDKFIKRILSSKDLFKEEIIIQHTGFGGAPTVTPDYKGKSNLDFLTLGKSGYKYAQESWKDFFEPENFTQDIDWMPNVVLLAKNTYVWLDQLSKKYKREIKRLDQVPDEELDLLAKWNFNGLWLIGIWERSNASKKIKHMMGNIDAVSSAYSLYDYIIAHDLGGEEAYNNLNHRCKIRGIRLASDMVPNHTGIFSDWIINHPNYFIQTNQSPFPNYSFHGPDLSDNESVQIRIEDGYWRRTDAAVVFQRIDNRTGEVKYIYHGNDGTNMPWNDTAQLNMLEKEVREAVIQKILEVAKKFSIIRFDAAMTLTKKHFSRLWYPEPGRGGDIPSRADFSMTKEEFDQKFPEEFWREVVDRINYEMPETLLLAEAFWLLEGYFVRSLGMHRVYNSAFMHMMMKEENNKYKKLITETLEFEPEILKRYVNFMSNPDEETAIKQFGSDDKYFGVCTLMVTLPGLPMFAHGQIEGYHEKYGMEYQRAYYNETPNQWLIERHEREIFPLIKKRYLFSHVTNFWYYDFVNNYGNIDENVFAFTNSEKGERAIVFYNNKYQSVSGKIYRSTPKLVSVNDKKELQTKTLGEALGIKPTLQHFYIYREHISNLEYLKSGSELAFEGFHVDLQAFKYKVFLNFREVYDADGDYEKLELELKGKGVPSIKYALTEMKLKPIHHAFEDIFDEDTIQEFINDIVLGEEEITSDCCQIISKKYNKLINVIIKHFGININVKNNNLEFSEFLNGIKVKTSLINKYLSFKPDSIHRNNFHPFILSPETDYNENSILLIKYLVISSLKKLFNEEGEINSNNFIEKMMLDIPVRKIIERLGKGMFEVDRIMLLLKIILNYNDQFIHLFNHEKQIFKKEIEIKLENESASPIQHLFDEEVIKLFMGVNQYEGLNYYHKESYDELMSWIFSIYLFNNNFEEKEFIEKMNIELKRYLEIERCSNESNYILDRLIEKLKSL